MESNCLGSYSSSSLGTSWTLGKLLNLSVSHFLVDQWIVIVPTSLGLFVGRIDELIMHIKH
jgi:hypothetical protein